jgi:peptide/nickel transport system permease protein
MDISERLNVTQTEEFEPFLEVAPALVQKRRSQARMIFDRFMRNRVAIGGGVFLFLLVLFCFLGPIVLGRTNPDALDVLNANSPPTLAHPFGTDVVGRDLMARVMAGGQVSLMIAGASMLVSIVVGLSIGAIAGYFGGTYDNLLMRVTDIFLSVPLYFLLFVLSAAPIIDHSPKSVVFLISVLGWMYVARLVRSEYLSLKEREYVLAARTIGAKDFRMMFRHILPNAAGPIIVAATLLVGANIILESVLSFFSFGVSPPAATWGNMIADGQDFFYVDPWLVLVPGMFIFLTVLSFNLVGDGLRDALDPYETQR